MVGGGEITDTDWLALAVHCTLVDMGHLPTVVVGGEGGAVSLQLLSPSWREHSGKYYGFDYHDLTVRCVVVGPRLVVHASTPSDELSTADVEIGPRDEGRLSVVKLRLEGMRHPCRTLRESRPTPRGDVLRDPRGDGLVPWDPTGERPRGELVGPDDPMFGFGPRRGEPRFDPFGPVGGIGQGPDNDEWQPPRPGRPVYPPRRGGGRGWNDIA